jgi:glyoxylase-like metal-dependent hydrolase (beta-lactamase superfamily II)
MIPWDSDLVSDSERVAADLYLVKQPLREGWFCTVTIVFGAETIGLVDTGFQNTPEDFVFPLIRQLGRRVEEIGYVVNTHRDGDHVLGNQVVKVRTGAPIAVHELEAEAVETADVTLNDGEDVTLGDRVFTVVHTPGHRPGNICLHDAAHRVLITGDTVCGDRTDLIRMDPALYVDSLTRLAALSSDTLIMSHPFQPLGKCVLTGLEPAQMLQASVAIAENLPPR